MINGITLQAMKAQQKDMLMKQRNCTLYFKTKSIIYNGKKSEEVTWTPTVNMKTEFKNKTKPKDCLQKPGKGLNLKNHNSKGGKLWICGFLAWVYCLALKAMAQKLVAGKAS